MGEIIGPTWFPWGRVSTIQPMGSLGAPELFIVLVIVLVIFGGAKLPKLAKSLGEAQREFKKGSEEGAKADPVSDQTGTAAGSDADKGPNA